MSSSGTGARAPPCAVPGGPTRLPRRAATRSCGRASLGGQDPAALAERFGTPLFAYDLDVVDAPGRRPAGRAATGVRPRLRGQGQPEPRDHPPSGPAWPRRRRRLGRRAATRDAGRDRARPHRVHRARQARRWSWRRRSRPAFAPSPSNCPASSADWPGSPRGSAVASRCCSAPPPAEPARAGRVRLVGDEEPASSGWTTADLRTSATEAVCVTLAGGARAPRVRGVQRGRCRRSRGALRGRDRTGPRSRPRRPGSRSGSSMRGAALVSRRRGAASMASTSAWSGLALPLSPRAWPEPRSRRTLASCSNPAGSSWRRLGHTSPG